MPATLDEVKQVIQDAFPDSVLDEIHEERGRVIGAIRSPEFQDMDSEERNRLITERVRNILGLRGLNVGVLFPLAPGEDLD